MRRFLYKLKHDTKGAVTIFFVLIVAAVFFFHAVLIDYARILAAEQQSEYAVQSAARSALAGYDNDLREYGLFGIDGAAYESEFEDIVKTNLEPTSNDEAFTFIDPKLESASVEFSRPLADPDILEHQILEEMKYKAPVEVVKKLIEKFTFVTKAMKETSAFIDTAEKIQEDFEEREEHLDKVESIFEKLKSDVATFKKNLTHTQFSTYPNVNYFTDVIHHYNTYSGSADRIADLQTEIDNSNTNKSTLETKLKNKKKELIELEDDLEKLEDGKKLDPPKTKKELEEEIEELEKEIEDMEKSIKSSGETVTDNKEKIKEEEKDSKTFKEQAENKASEMHTLATRIISNLEDISSRIQKAKDLNEDIQNTIDEANADASNDYGNAEDIAEGPPDGASSVDNLEEAIRENSAKLEEYPYDSAFFNSIKEPIDKAITRMKDVPGLFEAIETDIDLSSKSALQQIKKDALAALNPSIEDIDSGSGTLEDDRKEFKETDEAVTDQQEQQAEDSNNQAEDMLNDLASIADDQQIYEELKQFVNQYNAYAQGSEGEIQEIEIGDNAGDSAGNAMDIVDSIFSGIGSILKNARDRVYVNEYILLHFESAVPTGIQNKADYLFENREVEYILYGQHASGANYSLALGQLFAIRFALRFIAAFAEPVVRAAGHPLAVFIAALSYSLKESIVDTEQVAKGESTPILSNRLTSEDALPMFYHDYLRLFLFMNPSGDARLRRIMAVIEKNTGVSLIDRQTYVEGTAETSANLIFVPQIANTLNLVGALDGQSEDGRFVFKSDAHFSY